MKKTLLLTIILAFSNSYAQAQCPSLNIIDAYIFTSKSKDDLAEGIEAEEYGVFAFDLAEGMGWKSFQKAWGEGEITESTDADMCVYTLKHVKFDDLKLVLEPVE